MIIKKNKKEKKGYQLSFNMIIVLIILIFFFILMIMWYLNLQDKGDFWLSKLLER